MNTNPYIVRVIGDVIDFFVPSVSMSVQFGTKHVNNGCDIKPSMAAAPPRVTITGNADELYTLVMTDPDAPSPSDPTLKEWVHWIVTDIPGGSSVTEGKEILEYVGPQPMIGIHRYILVLFQQSEGSEKLEAPASREQFSTRGFAAGHDLGMPVATVYFIAHKEPRIRPPTRKRNN